MYRQAPDIDIGWCRLREDAAFAFAPPRSVFSTRGRPLSIRAVQNCPAVNDLERRLIEIPCPIDIRLRAVAEEDGPAVYVVPEGTTAKEEEIARTLTVEPPERWRDPKRPVLRLHTPFCFVTDAPCQAAFLPPFLDSGPRRWPGSMIAGDRPLHLWPNAVSWAFEWEDFSRDLTLKGGDPLCYLLPSFGDIAARPNLVEAALTDALRTYRENMAAVAEIDQDFDAFLREAEARRPASLLTRVTR